MHLWGTSLLEYAMNNVRGTKRFGKYDIVLRKLTSELFLS